MRRAGNGVRFQIGNHDVNRVAGRFGSDTVNALTLLLPRTAIAYMEIGTENTNVRWNQTADPAPDPYRWDAFAGAGFSVVRGGRSIAGEPGRATQLLPRLQASGRFAKDAVLSEWVYAFIRPRRLRLSNGDRYVVPRT